MVESISTMLRWSDSNLSSAAAVSFDGRVVGAGEALEVVALCALTDPTLQSDSKAS